MVDRMVTSKDKMVEEESDEFNLAKSEEEASSQEAMRLATEKYDRCDIYLVMELLTDVKASTYHDMYGANKFHIRYTGRTNLWICWSWCRRF